MFSKVLVANRGEIAIRLIRACRDLGVHSIAVYSDADRDALHVKLADEAHHIGEATPSESYLNIDKIVAVGKKAGAEAVHPGYGFLAENADFVRTCEDNDLVFIGPPADVMRRMGDKAQAKAEMREAGVPLVPGTEGTASLVVARAAWPKPRRRRSFRGRSTRSPTSKRCAHLGRSTATRSRSKRRSGAAAVASK